MTCDTDRETREDTEDGSTTSMVFFTTWAKLLRCFSDPSLSLPRAGKYSLLGLRGLGFKKKKCELQLIENYL